MYLERIGVQTIKFLNRPVRVRRLYLLCILRIGGVAVVLLHVMPDKEVQLVQARAALLAAKLHKIQCRREMAYF